MTEHSVSKQLPDPSLLMRLRMRQILLLARLGADRHLGRAAKALHMSQPAATKLLRQLEETLAVSLFTRLPLLRNALRALPPRSVERRCPRR